MAATVIFRSITIVLVLVAFVFLLLATILTPVAKSLHLGASDSFTYGLFGYCETETGSCIKATYPYVVSSNSDADVFKILSPATRNTMVKLFITAPIAAFFSLVSLVFVALSAFISISALVPLILVLLLFFASVVCTVGIILAFYPKVQWLGWLSVGASAALLLSLIFLVLTLLDPESNADEDDDDLEKMIDEDLDIGKSRSNLGFQPPSSGFAVAKGGYTVGSAQSYNDTSSSISRTYNSNNYQSVKQGQGIANTTSNTMYSSLYNEKPQTQVDVTSSVHNAPNLNIAGNNNSGSIVAAPFGVNGSRQNTPSNSDVNLPYPVNAANSNNVLDDIENDGYNFNDKRFDDDALDLSNMQRNQANQDSDLDLDFTSVLQRPPNPNYSGASQNYPNASNYQPSYGFQPPLPQIQQQSVPPPQVPSIQPQYNQYFNSQPVAHNIVTTPQYAATTQQYSNYYSSNYVRSQQPTISDTVLNSNPDFQLAGATAHKRRNNGGFIPPSQRYNKPGMSR